MRIFSNKVFSIFYMPNKDLSTIDQSLVWVQHTFTLNCNIFAICVINNSKSQDWYKLINHRVPVIHKFNFFSCNNLFFFWCNFTTGGEGGWVSKRSNPNPKPNPSLKCSHNPNPSPNPKRNPSVESSNIDVPTPPP